MQDFLCCLLDFTFLVGFHVADLINEIAQHTAQGVEFCFRITGRVASFIGVRTSTADRIFCFVKRLIGRRGLAGRIPCVLLGMISVVQGLL